MSNIRPRIRNSVALLLTMVLPAMAAVAAEDHLVPISELHRDAAAVTQTREGNIAKAERFFKSEPVEKTLHSFKMDGDQVMRAVPMLSDAELAQLSSRIDSAQTDFAAGALDNEHITYIIIALAAAVIVLVLIR
jgi:hypothetical protein